MMTCVFVQCRSSCSYPCTSPFLTTVQTKIDLSATTKATRRTTTTMETNTSIIFWLIVYYGHLYQLAFQSIQVNRPVMTIGMSCMDKTPLLTFSIVSCDPSSIHCTRLLFTYSFLLCSLSRRKETICQCVVISNIYWKSFCSISCLDMIFLVTYLFFLNYSFLVE